MNEKGWQTPEGFIAHPSVSERLPAPRTRVAFSLFEGDLVNRLFARIRLHERRAVTVLLRCLVLVATTWGVVAIAALFVTDIGGVPPPENFFKDFAAYLMFVVGLPLFVIAEPIVGEHTREAADYFLVAGIVPAGDAPLLNTLHRRVERLRKSLLPELLCLAVAYALAIPTILPKTSSVCPNWHTTPVTAHGTADEVKTARQKQRDACAAQVKAREKDKVSVSPNPASQAAGRIQRIPSTLNLAGWCEMLVALPILNYWWLRWIWKIGLWSWYLWQVSRLPLLLTASHPDETGGLGFVSDVQTKFGLVIVAYGISNVASTVGYEIGVEHASWSLYTVWCPLLIFAVGAPLLFTLPLFMFTKRLYRVKKRARKRLYEQVGERTRVFNATWQTAQHNASLGADLFQWQQLRNLYEHIEKMRIVPFDLRSFAELVGQTLGSLVPLLAYLNLPDWLMRILEGSSHMLH